MYMSLLYKTFNILCVTLQSVFKHYKKDARMSLGFGRLKLFRFLIQTVVYIQA